MKPRLLLFAFCLSIVACSHSTHQEKLLNRALVELQKIKSAEYSEARCAYIPGDTLKKKWSTIDLLAYDNPKDTTIGACWVQALHESDTTKFLSAYDGDIHAVAYHEHKGVLLDDFATLKLPFRPIMPPFFFYARNIVEYALSTTDSVEVAVTDRGESYHLSLTIHEETQVEFFGRAYHMPELPEAMRELRDPTSNYEIWFDSATNLPTKIYREMDHSVLELMVESATFNHLSIDKLNINDHFPAGYEIRMEGPNRKRGRAKAADLIGTQAPTFALKDANEKTTDLCKTKSKATLLNFTGIGCGPCQLAISMLNELSKEYNRDELQILSIESWGKEAQSLDFYAKKYNIKYPFLVGQQSVIDDYNISGVPVFILLDSSLTVKHVYTGYTPSQSDDEIRSLIEEVTNQ